MTMAADVGSTEDSCIFDPNFAIICSFFEKFSTLCGIKQHTILELQLMIDSTEEIPPQLIDLHVRLMRKAKKNVNPDRWQRTLAKFCYFNLPDDCWELEQKGYKQLHYSQRLRILLALIGAQFDHNIKFKTDVNKLEVNDLRLSPFGRDKDGNSYWLHVDQDLNLKVYKEDLEEETWELVVSDRDSLDTLIKDLIKVKDPNRKLDDIEEEEEDDEDENDDDDDDIGEHDKELDNDIKDEKMNDKNDKTEKLKDCEKDQGSEMDPTRDIEKNVKNEIEKQVKGENENENEDDKSSENVSTEIIQDPVEPNISPKSNETSAEQNTAIQSMAKENANACETVDMIKPNDPKITKRNPLELTFRPRFTDVRAPVKPLDKRGFASHLQKLDSNNMLRPLLNTKIPVNPGTSFTDKLKTKLCMKLKPEVEHHPIKAKTTADVLLSKVKKIDVHSGAGKPAKPGLKLEQILKSKLAQKLAANSPSTDTKELESSDNNVKNENELSPLSENENKSSEVFPMSLELPIDTSNAVLSKSLENQNRDGSLKRKLSEDGECKEAKKIKTDSQNEEEEEEIEEAVMLVTGVGNGHDCDTGNNETDSEKTEHNPAATNAAHLTHKVDDILKNAEHDQGVEAASTSVDDFPHKFSSSGPKSDPSTTLPIEVTEKKKPKLWTIDAICSSDSKTTDVTKNRYDDDVSLFPNYSFNKESKKSTENSSSGYRNSTESSYSIFNLSSDTVKDDHSMSAIPTNFYFGCNNQNPCFLPTERSINTFKPPTNKSHNVKDIVENLDSGDCHETTTKATNFNVDNLCSKQYESLPEATKEEAFNLCVRGDENCIETHSKMDVEDASEQGVDECSDASVSKEKVNYPLQTSNLSGSDNESVDVVENNDTTVKEAPISEDKSENMAVNEEKRLSVNVITAESVESTSPAAEINAESVDIVSEQAEQTPIVTEDTASDITDSKSSLTPITITPDHIPVTDVTDEAIETDMLSIDQIKNDNEDSAEIVESSEQVKSITAEEKSPPRIESPEIVPCEITDKNEICEFENENVIDEVVERSPDISEKASQLTADATEEHCSESSDEQITIEAETAKQVGKVTDEIKDECNKEEPSSNDVEDEKTQAITVEIPVQEELDEPILSETQHPESIQFVQADESEPIKTIEHVQETAESVTIEAEKSAEVVKTGEDSKDCEISNTTNTKSLSDVLEDKTELVEETVAKFDDEQKTKKSKLKMDVPSPPSVVRTSIRLARSARAKNTTPTISRLSPAKKKTEKDSKTAKKGKLKDKIGKEEEEKEETIAKEVDTETEDNEASIRGSRKSKRKSEPKEIEKLVIITESKSKKNKNRTGKNDESEQEEILDTKPPLRKGRSRSTKDEISDNEENVESKPVKKGKNKVVQSFAKEPKENETSKRTGKNRDSQVLANEGVDSETNEDVPIQSKRSKSKKKAAKSKKSMSAKAEIAGSGDEKDSAVLEKNRQNDTEVNKELKSKKLVKLKTEEGEEDTSEKKENKLEKSPVVKKRTLKRGWLNDVDVNNIETTNDGSPGIRQSRRIAQLKIKEQAEVKYVEPVTTPKKSAANQKSKTPVSSTKKNGKTSVKKSSKYKPSKEDSDEGSLYEKSVSSSRKKKKKKDPKKNFNVRNAWKTSSGSSSEEEEAEDEDHFEDDEELVINDGSDHEFSPESDIDDDDEYTPVKRARTAHSKPATEDKPERDDLLCQSCGTADQPEWILLCDMCDEGWHASCLKPAIMSIPEGDWFCPPCQHNKLITNLQKYLRMFDKSLKKRANEELRKKRLEFVGISFSNIIADQNFERKIEPKPEKPESDKTVVSDEYTEESEDEPLYQLRIRRQANVSHRLNEYEELMNSAIRRDENGEINEEVDMNVTPSYTLLQNGQESSKTEIVPNEEMLMDDDKEKNENEAEIADNDNIENQEKVSPVVLQLRGIRKKPPRLTKLDVSSDDDHFSDEDFKGSSGDQEDEEEYGKSETDSDEVTYRKGHKPVRRSTRARITRYDNDFINDDSEDEDDEYHRNKKKKRARYSDSNSEEEDSTWGKRKRNKSQQWKPPSRKKKRRRITFEGDSDEEKKKNSRRSRVKFGLDESEDDYPQRRTRGKKISYLDNLGSESEEDTSTRRKQKKIISDDDDEYINEEDEHIQHNSGKENVDENGEEGFGSDADAIPDNAKMFKPTELNSDTTFEKSISPSKSPSVKISLSDNSSEVTHNIPPLKTYSKAADLTNKEKTIDQNNVHSEEPSSVSSAEMKKKSGKSPKKEVQMYSGVVKGDNKLLLKKVDTNPSLEGLQSMAQNLSQNMNSSTPSSKYPPTSVIHDTKYQGLVPGSSASATPVNFADVGISYEDPDDPPVTDEKYAPPIRVVSPSKLYGMQEDQPLNRPPLPFAVGSRMQPRPPILGPPENAMMLPTRPLPIRGPMMQGPPMQHINAPPHSGPPPNVNISQCGPIKNVNTSPNESASRRGRRGRGKKQLEMERLEREREAMESNRGDEMMPLHMLKLPSSDINLTRPSAPYNNPGPQFATYPPNVQRMPFSQASTAPPSTSVTVTVGNTPKRVKITPTRMRMPGSQNIMRFPRVPGNSVLYISHPHDSSPSSGNTIVTNDNKAAAIPGSTAAVTMPVKTEAQMSVAGVKMESPDQYYHPTSYSPSQMPRAYNQRPPEFSFVRNPLPPMYRQPQMVSSAPITATTTSFVRPPYTNTSSVLTVSFPPPPSTTINSSPTTKTEVTSTPSQVPPHSYPSTYPLASTSAPVTTKTNRSPASYTTSAHVSQSATPTSNPPISATYQTLHMKPLPSTSPQSSTPGMPYTAPYYTSTMMPNSYPPPSQLPPVSSFVPNAPSTFANQQGSRIPLAPTLQQQPQPQPQQPPSSTASALSAYKHPPVSTRPSVSPSETSTNSSSNEYLAPISQSGSSSRDFQYSNTAQSVPTGESENNRTSEYESSFNQSSSFEEEKQTSEETSTGEFDGLVSYFSSQHEDDLDS